ncbi:MAG: heavy-metal-associated domain-containing protein [Prosthecobacter sp.]
MSLPQTFPLTGMSCESCVKKITARLREHPDVSEAVVTLKPPQARIMTRTAFSDETMNDWLKPLGKYRVEAQAADDKQPDKDKQSSYRPLVILLAYLLLVVAAASVMHGGFELSMAMRLFMGGFFVAFSFFKMLDLRGFSDAYRGYDLVAKAVPAYGFVYPFIELGLGLAYLANWQPVWVNAATAVVMGVSLLGVLKAVLSKQTIRCACLGTVFNLPMSTVTIVEDALMLIMAVVALVLPHG